MNLVDAYVKEVLGEPYFLYDKWWVTVKGNSFGVFTVTEIMCDTEEEAKLIKPGYHYLT